MIIVLNGPLGIGKSTLAEALTEQWASSVMLDGDYLIAMNPEPDDALIYLHKTISLLIEHHLDSGYTNFVVNHIWHSEAELGDLIERVRKVDPDQEVRCVLLTLAEEEHLKRVSHRRISRAIDESEYEFDTLFRERERLYGSTGKGPGEPFDVSASPEELVKELQCRLRGE